MLVIRPIGQADHDQLYSIAEQVGTGFTSLPANHDLITQRIERSEAAFAQEVAPEHARYLFVMEDQDSGKVAGICGLDARVGLGDVWYNYRVSTMVNASAEMGIHVQTPTLYLTNDMTNCSELCSLFLSESYRQSGNGLFLSRSRSLFLAEFRHLFADKLFAEMRGVSDEQGRSPFWEALGRRFFDMDFKQADYLTGIGRKSFIAELMPKYPIYLPLLPREARNVVGQVHDSTRPALRMLEAEGFNFNGLVDIFDAGPVVEAFVHNIRTVRESFNRHVLVSRQPLQPTTDTDQMIMVCNSSFRDFRATVLPVSAVKADTISIPTEAAEALLVSSGDVVRIARLKGQSSQTPASNRRR